MIASSPALRIPTPYSWPTLSAVAAPVGVEDAAVVAAVALPELEPVAAAEVEAAAAELVGADSLKSATLELPHTIVCLQLS